MAKSSYNVKDLYSVFNEIDDYFWEKTQDGGGTSGFANESIRKYCPYRDGFKKELGTCYDYLEMARSGVINLLKMLKEKHDLEYDKLAEYAILFLSYKLKQHSQHKSTNLNTFYANHIKNNNYYYNKIKVNGPTYKDIIDKKKDLMNMNINEISKFNVLFSILCKLYTECDKKKSYTNCSNDARDFANKFEELNDDSNINGNTSYRKLLSTLSNDYDNFKIYCAEKCNGCNDLPPLPKVKTPPSKLIPALSTFSVIPVFLGIAYKYSLFGVDKIFQRQYIRKKLKNVKKKMKINI
ncbi:CIR protein PIR protein [Plasmodium vinckei petteri]|uniref:CIR protein PIR protein n=1 Tax=Plasmodium vinckei petteri TaxID=138298 RepID=A0A6V7SEB7_PLAVN|nr:CIR protein PIR protein [Plasmodium vinckei petteri]